jgi:hypothetical protein
MWGRKAAGKNAFDTENNLEKEGLIIRPYFRFCQNSSGFYAGVFFELSALFGPTSAQK